MTSFGGGASIKAFPIPSLKAFDATNENTYLQAFVSSALHLFVMFV
jgi:hypothetical protein